MISKGRDGEEETGEGGVYYLDFLITCVYRPVPPMSFSDVSLLPWPLLAPLPYQSYLLGSCTQCCSHPCLFGSITREKQARGEGWVMRFYFRF